MIEKFPLLWWARRRVKAYTKYQLRPDYCQKRALLNLIGLARNTAFGRAHGFDKINSIKAYQERVPLTDFYGLDPWIERATKGEPNQLWPGVPRYFGQTSGTTGKPKLIPLTSALLSSNRQAELDLLASVILESDDPTILRDPLLVLTAQAETGRTPGGSSIGFASSILVKTWFPFVRKHVIPDNETLNINSWDDKIEAIARQSEGRRIRGSMGVTPVQLAFFRHLINTGRLAAGRPLTDIWPQFTYLIHAGVQWESCREQVRSLIGSRVIVRDFYGATEAFMGIQLDSKHPGMTPQMTRVFFEFVPLTSAGKPGDARLLLSEVEAGVDYAIALTTPGGLWSYLLGDTVRFSSVKPYYFKVAGRISEMVNTVGEKVNSREASLAIGHAMERAGLPVPLFVLAPRLSTRAEDVPCHEWILEFPSPVGVIRAVADDLDRALCEESPTVAEARRMGVIGKPRVTVVPCGTFAKWEKKLGIVAGQGKLPLLVNARAVADDLLALADAAAMNSKVGS